jgi:anti-sigma factor RsiW
MISDPWTARLSDYLDSGLSETERSALERHLAACPACTAAVAQLGAVRKRARALPDTLPPTDLWPGIASRIAQAPQPRIDATPARRRWTFSLPQLAAAALAIGFASGGSAWLATRHAAGAPPLPVATGPTPSVAPPGPSEMPAGLGGAKYEAAVTDLERVLEADRGALDTSTVRIIEQNLAVIDRAIADARRALAADPGNAYLNAHLAGTMRRKIDLLRRAATIVASRS